MPQIFQVLRCYKCLVFQVHQTKKSQKWECKLCGVKQSIKRHYGIGIAKDCRIHVQKLNSLRGEIDEFKCGQMSKNLQSYQDCEDEELLTSKTVEVTPQLQPVNSKWSNYVEKSEPIEEVDNEPMHLDGTEVVFEIPKKRRKFLSNYCKSSNNSIPVRPTTDENTEHRNYSNGKVKPLYRSHIQDPAKVLYEEDTKTSIVDILPENRIEKENTRPNVVCKKFVPPVIKKDSKWVGFLEDEVDVTSAAKVREITSIDAVQEISSTQEVPETTSTCLDFSQNNHIFSLCNNNELDSVLDI